MELRVWRCRVAVARPRDWRWDMAIPLRFETVLSEMAREHRKTVEAEVEVNFRFLLRGGGMGNGNPLPVGFWEQKTTGRRVRLPMPPKKHTHRSQSPNWICQTASCRAKWN